MAGQRRYRNRTRRIAVTLTMAVTSFLSTAVHAQQRAPLKLSIRPTVDVMRSNSPLLLDATLTWSSPRLLEGRLELDLYVAHRRVAEYRSREVALSESKVTLPLMLPPVTPADEQTACTLQARFEGTDESIELGAYDVPAPVQRRRVLVVGVVVAEDSSNPPAGIQAPEDRPFALQESLRIESRLTRDDMLRDVSCRVVEVLPESVPDCGLELCGYDALIVTSDGLDELRTDQLEAIADWVEAGGSTCVVPELVRDRRQQSLLQRIAGGSAVEPVLAFDANGMPRLLRSGPGGWHRGAPGIGRSIVADSPIDVLSTEWQREVCYLLAVRDSHVEEVLTPDQAPRDESSIDEGSSRYDLDYQPFAPRPLADEARLPLMLIPKKIAGVPFRLVCGLLAGCLLAVAPGEYFLLGVVRRRRWTWIVFPCTAVSCTLFMIGLAQSYVGNADHATSLTFVDLASDGRVVRTSRFELTFTATERMLDAPLERRFVVALDQRPRPATVDDPFSWQQQPEPLPTPTPFDVAQSPFVYDGRSPVSYTLSRPMRQWSPRLARWTAFGRQAAAEPPLPGADWSAATVESLADQGAQRTFAARVQQAAPAAHVLVASTRRSMWLNSERLGFAPDDPAAPIAGLAFAASVREPEGLFEYFTQRSPTCGGDMEDLALLDRTNPRQQLVIVLVADGAGSYTAYRRLERGLE